MHSNPQHKKGRSLTVQIKLNFFDAVPEKETFIDDNKNLHVVIFWFFVFPLKAVVH